MGGGEIKSSSIIGNGNITAKKVYFDLSLQANCWYFMSFPFKVRISDIICKGNWIFRYYEQNPYKIKWLPKIKNYESKSKALATYIQSTNLLLLLIILYVTLCSTQLVHMRPLIIVLILLLMVVPYIYIYNKIRKSNSGTD